MDNIIHLLPPKNFTNSVPCFCSYDIVDVILFGEYLVVIYYLVFDDTIEHEAWNDADETRVILIFDVWNPLLSEAERELISALLREHSQWLDQSAARS